MYISAETVINKVMCYSDTRQQHFTILEVATDWREAKDAETHYAAISCLC